MTAKERQEITDYLCGPRDFFEGAALYRRFGVNLRLKRLFATDDSAFTRDLLFEELRKLAGLSQKEFERLPRRAANANRTPADENAAELAAVKAHVAKLDDDIEILEEMLEEERSRYAETPEPIRKMIRFRERYQFLNSPDCPDVLKVLVADMFTAFDSYKAAHARLQALPDGESAAALADCEKVVEGYLENREIWDELDYYKEHGALLGKAAKFREAAPVEDYSELSEIDLMKKLNSATVNESKHRKTVKLAAERGETDERAQAAFRKWSAAKKALQEEVARRKKK